VFRVYTDGAYNWEEKRGGWAALILQDGKEEPLSGSERETTGNRMELTAAIKALERLPKGAEATIYSDSEYLIKSMRGEFRRKANLDLWQRLDELVKGRRIDWQWVKGHSGDPFNERVNALAEWRAGLRARPPDIPAARSPAHQVAQGRARMVDVGKKPETEREAVAKGFVAVRPETLALIREGTLEKGDVLGTARLAGVMAAKRTHELIPLCHPLPLSYLDVDLQPEEGGISITATARAVAKTGVEMEALTAVAVAALTIYDMVKAVDRGARIEAIRLVRKRGGKSGEIKLE
jgi:cyclic pyranopterin phosphate synthase